MDAGDDQSAEESLEVIEDSEIYTPDDIANIEDLYRRYGYEPPGRHSMAPSFTSNPNNAPSEISSTGQTRKRKPKTTIDARSGRSYLALCQRNINFKPCVDDKIKSIKRMILADHHLKPTDEEEKNWKADLLKCESSDEALFQRTIMMDLIDRHNLENPLDYVCESAWQCARMPRKDQGPVEITQPKPDLAVAFKTTSLVPVFEVLDLGLLKSHMCPEGAKEGKDDRAFHFFSMEVKGARAESENSTIAVRQNFNTATQALHNIYLFMKKADDESTFFEKVRFYSAIATSVGFQVRVHRAVKLGVRGRIRPDYPLAFEFDELFRTRGVHYTKAEVSGIVKNILYEYGIVILLPILKNAVEVVMDKIENATASQTSKGKRPAEEVLESFDSARIRVGGLGMGDADSVASQSFAEE